MGEGLAAHWVNLFFRGPVGDEGPLHTRYTSSLMRDKGPTAHWLNLTLRMDEGLVAHWVSLIFQGQLGMHTGNLHHSGMRAGCTLANFHLSGSVRDKGLLHTSIGAPRSSLRRNDGPTAHSVNLLCQEG